MAAALNIPLTGVVLTVEVMGASLAPRKLLSILTGSATAAALGRIAYTEPRQPLPIHSWMWPHPGYLFTMLFNFLWRLFIILESSVGSVCRV